MRCWLVLLVVALTARASDIVEPASVEGLSVWAVSRDVLLSWPSDPRESFVVLWRSNATYETPWIALTNQLPAASKTNWTTYCDFGAPARAPSMSTNPALADFYKVVVVPDFWFDMEGVILSGGPKDSGEDFLPLYNGTKETWDLFKPRITLLVDGEQWSSARQFGEERGIERVNYGAPGKPQWTYSRGIWFGHNTLPNGWHTLQLTSLLTLNNSVGERTWYVKFANKPVRVRTTNDITYVGFQALILSSNYTYVAQSVQPRVSWRYEIRDYKGQFLASGAGQTTNGEIRWTWDLRDTHGTVHDRSEIDPHPLVWTLTTEPLDKEANAGREASEIGQGPAELSWWDRRLGKDFLRSRPDPDEDQVLPRPWNAASPPDRHGPHGQ